MIRSFALPLADPLATARGAVDRREGFLFQRDGGLGEATPLPGWTESLRACERALGDAERADDWPDALDACEDAPAARHAVSLAGLDASARDADESLADALADGDPADAVPVNATVGDASVEETVAAAERAADEGFGTVKLKVGAREVSADVERVQAVRDATDLAVRADANGAWTREQAHDACYALGHVGVEYVEQPLPAHDLAGHADLRGSVDVALDESLTEYPVADVLTAADAVVLKPMALGGVDRARDAALAAREAGVEPVVTTTVDAAVARTAAVHLAASVPDVGACGLATARFLETDLAADPAPVADGRVRVPDGPGHGVDVASGGLPGGTTDA
ncbi:mandelate racemase/muconate lactonizing enzyme family protein [Halobacterium yunchengense]|uniref:mandelate racemase/muconate lactonizing enzyme family protein n=1 Tax=Halobacterium yunchengense TaxID=3108497 RepID=UPI003008ADCA